MSQPSAPARRGRIAYEPALDGLRGAGLVAMLCFHARFEWAKGGFLALAMFFTLSGYLITSLFLAEREQTGRIDVLAFWGRRLRRLMPAAILTLAGMSLFGWLVATPEQASRLRADVVSALFYFANWHLLWSDAAYTNLFEAPSPVHHFWSLSIEEQFYFAFPPLLLAFLALARGSRARLGVLLLAASLASVVAGIALTVSGSSIDRMYYGTDARACEILLGTWAAVVLRDGIASGPRVQLALRRLGLPALAAMVLLWGTIDLESRWLYEGGLAAYALLSIAVIAAAVQPGSAVRAVLSAPILLWLGRVSYGAYLFHWPLFLWISPERTGMGEAMTFVMRLLVTFALAELSLRLLETPIRTRRALTGWRPWLATPMAFAAVVIAAAAVPASSIGGADLGVDEEAVKAFAARFKARERPTDPPPPDPTTDRPRIAVFGDSTAVPISLGLHYVLDRRDVGRVAEGFPELGCGLLRKGQFRTGTTLHSRQGCARREITWRRAIDAEQPEVAVVSIGPWDVRDRKLPGDDTWRAPGDPVFDAYLREELLAATDLLAKDGTLVVWLTQPPVDIRDKGGVRPAKPYAASDPKRMQRLNDVIRELETLRPGRVRVLDLAAYMETLPGGPLDERYRPDGTHLTAAGGVRIAEDWLVEEVLRTHRERAAALRAAAGTP